ncbi:uncharacterized protein LOC127873751 isoform X2 [Dreissena polymorpha]|uniref:uncharacterized protein LOC127873751 isoform X2 n=1 Tax=Dreissena polymorpha TaxID=45954 RepID=UPI0022651EEA|nr:uncharacterized protein LOC127873751 isoform X2 [Dreissena polymorpha]
MAKGGSVDFVLTDVEDTCVKYFNFLMQDRCAWIYDETNKTIQVFPPEDDCQLFLKDVFSHFKNRSNIEIVMDCDQTIVEEFLNGTKIRKLYKYYEIETQTNMCCVTAFSSVSEDLRMLQHECESFVTRRKELAMYSDEVKNDIMIPGEKLETFCLASKHSMCVSAGYIFDFDGPDVGIVNPVVVRKSGEIHSKGVLFHLFEEKGGQKYKDSLKEHRATTSSCIVTRGGSLQAKIIHPTRPIDDKKMMETNIFINICDCLSAALSNKLGRIVFPLMYSGRGEVPLQKCTYQYAYALTDFFRMSSMKSLDPFEIFFVEIDKKKAKEFVQELLLFLPTRSTKLMIVPRCNSSLLKDKLDKHVFDNTTVIVKVGDIVEANVDAIVCPEYITAGYKGYVTNAIHFAFRIKSEKVNKQIHKWKESSDWYLHPKCKRNVMVYHTAAVALESGSFKIKDESEKGLRNSIERVFEKLKKDDTINSIAIPLIGVIDATDTMTVRQACKVFIQSVLSCCSAKTGGPILHVQLVNHCQQITDWLQEYMHIEVLALTNSCFDLQMCQSGLF